MLIYQVSSYMTNDIAMSNKSYVIGHWYCIFIVTFSYLLFNKLCFNYLFCLIIYKAFTKGEGRQNEPNSLLKFRLNQNQGLGQLSAEDQSKS